MVYGTLTAFVTDYAHNYYYFARLAISHIYLYKQNVINKVFRA